MITCESNTPRSIARVVGDIQVALDSFMEAGYFALHRGQYPGWDNWSRIPEATMHALCRDTAAELKRPFIRVYTGWNRDVNNEPYRTYVKLIVPRRASLAPIINPLTLTKRVNHTWQGGTHTVCWYANTRDFYFYFNRDTRADTFEQKQAPLGVWDQYALQFYDNPDFRKACKL